MLARNCTRPEQIPRPVRRKNTWRMFGNETISVAARYVTTVGQIQGVLDVVYVIVMETRLVHN